MNREYHHWHSPNLDRKMELLIFGHAGKKVLVFPTRCGRFYDFENWRLVKSVESRVQSGELQLICVDSVDAESLYNLAITPRERIDRHLQYEKYIIEEVLPFINKKNQCPLLTALGCSLGGYHAVNIAFRNPYKFQRAVSFSGRFALCEQVGSFRNLFDGYYDDEIYYNTPSHFIPRMPEGPLLDQLRKMKVTLVIGDWDAFIANNLHMKKSLDDKGVTCEYFQWREEAHAAYYWRRMLPLYL